MGAARKFSRWNKNFKDLFSPCSFKGESHLQMNSSQCYLKKTISKIGSVESGLLEKQPCILNI